MTDTAYFIKDRATSLAYEAKRFPATAETVLAWIRRAMDWAKARGLNALQKELEAMCYGMNCPHENSYSGECTFHGRGYYPCNDWGEEAQEDASPEGEEE